MIARDGRCIPKAWGAPGDCFGRLTFHHVVKESQGGRYSEDNGLAACVYHNEWVENEPNAARALGLVRRLLPEVPPGDSEGGRESGCAPDG